jgi:membrane protein YdbS with pleckstrin-like domain
VDLDDQRWLHPAHGLLLLRRAECLLFVALPGLAAAVVVTVVTGPLQGLAVLVVTALLTALALVAVDRRVRAWGYAEREDDLLVRRGVLVERLSVVPYGRMQYVDVSVGPLERAFGICTLKLHTASPATNASLPGLPTEEGTRLREQLSARGEARLAGL